MPVPLSPAAVHVSTLQIDRFRGVRASRLDGLRRVTLLLGRNNVGKTSFLEALYVATGVGSPQRLETLARTRGVVRADEVDIENFFYQRQEEPFRIWLGVSGQTETEMLSGSGEPVPPPTDLIVIGHVRRGSGDGLDLFADPETYEGASEITGVELDVSGRLLGPERASATLFLRHTDPARPSSYRRPRLRVAPALEPFRRSVFISASAIDTGLSKRLSDVVQAKQKDRVVSVLHQIDERIVGLELGDRDQVFVDVGLPSLLPLGLMGTGVRRLLSIVTTILTAEGSLVLIDEVDAGLHHSALLLLWEAVLEAAAAFDVQVVATTHSREALERLVEAVEREGAPRDDRGAVAAFDLVRGESDEVRAYRYDFEQLDFALEHDLDVRR